jgi:hypothetical protein
MLVEAGQRAGKPMEDKTNLIIILLVVNIILGVPTGMAIPYILQTEANRVWE